MSKRIDSPSSLAGSFPVEIVLPVEVKNEEKEEESNAEINSGET